MRQFTIYFPARAILLFFSLLCPLLYVFPAMAANVSLRHSIESALTYNPELKAGQEKRQVAGHAVEKARAGFYPRVAAEASGGFSQRSDATTRAHSRDDQVRAYADAGLRLIQPLWQGGYTTADVAVRGALYDSADSQLEDSGTSLAFQAIVAHVEVLRRTELVALAKNNVAEHGKILSTVRKRVGGQIATVGELHQVQGRHTRAKATLSSYESSLDAALAAYLKATGNAARDLEPATNPTKTYAGLDEVIQACLEHNKRIQSAMHEVSAAGGEKDMARSRFFPTIDLEAGPSWHDRAGHAANRITDVGVGLRVKWDLLSGGEDVANVAMAGARIRQARQNLHALMDELCKDIKSTYSQYLSAQEQFDLYGSAKKSSRLAREDYYRQFLSAQRNLLDVLDAENDYFYAAGQQVMSHGDRIIAGYRLLALSGELFPSLGVNPDRLRVDTPTTTEDTTNLRTAFPTSQWGQ